MFPSRAGRHAGVVRVLVVEDDEGVAGAVTDALAAHGHDVTPVARAADVWPALHGADLVLLDLGLPDGDGLEVLRGSAASARGRCWC